MRYLSKFLLIAVAVGLPMATAHATIRYIDPNGTDSGTCGSGAKCQTFSYAKSVASAGDDFEYSAGTYTLSGQAITGFSGVSTSDYSEVYCATELGCYINGGSTFQPLAVSGATYGWMNIHGFKLKASGNNSGVAEISGPDQSAEANHTHDILVSTMAMICNMETENTAGFQVAFVKNSTFTNIAVEGGRYSVLIYSSRWITVERALVTWKSWGIGAGTQNPVAAFTVYNVYDSTMSNVLVFDPRKPDPTANTNDENAMYLVSNSGATGSTYDHSQNVSFYGCVIINNKMNIAMTVEDNATNAKIRHLVIGGSAGYGLSSRLGSTGSFEFVTISSTGWSGTGDGVFDDSSLTFKHFQVAHGQNNANGGASMTYSNTYGYDDNTNAGTGNTTINPNIRHILVATNTATAGTGQSGANMGATVLYIFRNGVETNIPMWPWPNEDIFKTFMADASGFNYTDGVFGGTKTITNYVWEWMYGNRAPENFASGASQGGGEEPATSNTLKMQGSITLQGGVTFR